MKKNGFVFVETIVVCAILATSLVAIYSSFILVINSHKQRARYDQSAYNYRAYYAVKTMVNPRECIEGNGIPTEMNTLKDLYQIRSVNVINSANFADYAEDDNNYFKAYKKTIDESDYPNSCLYIFEFESPEFIEDETNESKNYFSLVSVELGG